MKMKPKGHDTRKLSIRSLYIRLTRTVYIDEECYV